MTEDSRPTWEELYVPMSGEITAGTLILPIEADGGKITPKLMRKNGVAGIRKS